MDDPSPAAVGFVGLGMMGQALVSRLLAASIPVVVANRSPGPVREAVAAGAAAAVNPREVGRRTASGIVFVMVSDGRAQRSVLFGRSGVAAGLAAGGLVVDLSTVAPADSRSAAARLAQRGIGFLDAPVGGSTDAAVEGRLLFFVGGAESDLARVRPYLARWARGIEHLGPVGAGATLKLANNLLTVGTLALLAEAVAFAEAAGIARDRVLEILAKGGGASAMLEAKRGALASREYPTRFKLSLARKDLGLFESTARYLGISPRLASAARRRYNEAIDAGLAGADFSAVFEVARPRAVRGSSEPGRLPDVDLP